MNEFLPDLISEYELTSAQLDREIQDSDRPVVARYFDKPEMYAQLMKLCPAEQANVRETKDVQDAMSKCLSAWKQINPANATFRNLLNMTLHLGKAQTANDICKYLTGE